MATDSIQPIGEAESTLDLARAWNCGVDRARRRKEVGEILPPSPTIGAACGQDELTCREILKNHKLIVASDKLFGLFMISGGGRLSPLQEALNGCPGPGGFARAEECQQLQPPRSLKNGLSIRADYDFLATPVTWPVRASGTHRHVRSWR